MFGGQTHTRLPTTNALLTTPDPAAAQNALTASMTRSNVKRKCSTRSSSKRSTCVKLKAQQQSPALRLRRIPAGDSATYTWMLYADIQNSTPANKLFSVKPMLGKNKPCTLLKRHDKTVITRLRIGHTRMTHSYLLSGESQPVCDHCKCLLL